MAMRYRCVRKAAVLALLVLSACAAKGSLDNSSVETVRVEGRLYEVRIAPTDANDEYRMMVVRATLVIAPDPNLERERASAVARPFMARTCKGRPYKVLEDRLVGSVNFYTRFRCGA